MNSIFEFDVTPRDPDPPLRPDRLAAGGTIDVQVRRRSAWPDRAMRWVNTIFWSLFFALGAGVVAASLVALS